MIKINPIDLIIEHLRSEELYSSYDIKQLDECKFIATYIVNNPITFDLTLNHKHITIRYSEKGKLNVQIHITDYTLSDIKNAFYMLHKAYML